MMVMSTGASLGVNLLSPVLASSSVKLRPNRIMESIDIINVERLAKYQTPRKFLNC